MNKEELQNWLDKWSLQPTDAAKVLRVNKSKMSEFLSGTRKVPVYIAAHIETFDYLADSKAKKSIEKRLK
jgi:plasmid maintenance system antidote protein VapI